MTFKAHAKLNILLNIHGKYFNGYHSIESVMIPISLCDVLDIKIIPCSNDIIIQSTDPSIPTDERNILYKCGKLFQKHFNISDGFKIKLYKNIPVQSGLGGESTDAACFMHFLNSNYHLTLPYNSMFYLGRLLSWDVPICYLQRCIYVHDKKEVCEILDIKSKLYFLLIMPDFGISTKKAFENLDKIQHENVDAYPLINALLTSPNQVGLYVHNCFIQAEPRLMKEYSDFKKISKQMGFDGVSMTGTGSCFFFITTKEDILTKGYNYFKDLYPFVSTASLVL